MAPIVLYKTDGSPPCRSTMMVIEILGLTVETVEKKPLLGQTKEEEFSDKNPMHSIPFIEDGNFGLSDSHAINTYIVSKYGADKKSILYPADVEVRATVDQRMYLDAAIFFPKIRELLITALIEKKQVPTEQQLESVRDAYKMLEKYLERNQFLAADHLTLADIALVASVSTLQFLIPTDDFPKLTEWFNTMQEYDWYKKVNVPGLETFKSLFQSQKMR